jgi:ATPase family AAA domain-containing protein 3A/B
MHNSSHNNEFLKAFQEFAQDARRAQANARREQEEKKAEFKRDHNQQINRLERMIEEERNYLVNHSNNMSEQERQDTRQHIREMEDDKRRLEERYWKKTDEEDQQQQKVDDIFLDITKGFTGTATEYMRQEILGKKDLEKAAATEYVRSKAQAQSNVTINSDRIKALKDPKNIFLIAGATSAFYMAKQGVLLAHELFQHHYKNPTIAQETSLLSLKEKCAQTLWGKPIVKKSVQDVILPTDLRTKIDTLTESIKNTKKNGAYFQNILLYGPPGTGKTMVAQRIARSCGIEYIYFAASSLLQLSEEEGLKKITELFEFAQKSPQKLMIIVDEAEKLFAHRKKSLDNKTRNLLTQVLTYTGTESRDYFVIGLTNLPEEIDPAFLSRCDEHIRIGAPEFEQRKAIIRKYINEYLIQPLSIHHSTKGILGSVTSLLSKRKTESKLIVSPAVREDSFISDIARRTEGFVGRDLAKMILSVQSHAYTLKSKLVSRELIEHIVEHKIHQHTNAHKGFSQEI